METIGVSISDVIHQIEAAAQETKGQRRKHGTCDGRGVE
jgi:hypothetical protein